MSLRATLGLVAAALAFVLLVGLGVWQLERRAEKHALIARIEARIDQPPIALPPRADWSAAMVAEFDYRPVTARVRFLPRDVLAYTIVSEPRGGRYSGPGYWVLTPAEVEGGGIVIVNRGFVPEAPKLRDQRTPPPTEVIALSAVLRQPEAANPFTPAPDARAGILFLRDPAAAAAMLGLDAVAPFTLDLVAPRPASGLPQGGETRLAFYDRHLEYALTWFGLAASLLAVLGALWWRRRASAALPAPASGAKLP